MRDDRRERDTLPPAAEELATIAEFENAARVHENDARLALLDEILSRYYALNRGRHT